MQAKFRQRGAVSIFVVIFATLLIVIATVGFVRVMISGQQQATSDDLSQSAYDSAQAGVEDAKRAIIAYTKACSSGDSAACDAAKNAIQSSSCNTALTTILSDVKETDGEIVVDSGADQAYTCVKVSLTTPDYLGVLKKDESKIIPLVGTSDFDIVKIEWFDSSDVSSTSLQMNSLGNFVVNPWLYSEWGSLTPSVLRSQLIQFGSGGFNLSGFNSKTYSSTLFLYPYSSNSDPASTPTALFGSDGNNLTGVQCRPSIASGGYACAVEIGLPAIGASGSRVAFLRLAALYNATHYKISLYNSSAPTTPINFNGVQLEVDSTGRAGTLFKRVKARVETNNSSFIYPAGAISTTSDFCKNFFVTDNLDNYDSSCD